MFKVSFTKTALDFIHEQQAINSLDNLVVAFFYYSSESWMMAFCGNVIELVEKKKVLDGYPEFVKYNNISSDSSVEVYVEKSILPELEQKELILVDAIQSESNGKKVGLLFMKRLNDDTYG